MPDYGSFYDNNLALKPETIRTVEGVVEQSLGSHVTVSGSVYRNWIDNLITVTTNPADGQSIYENSEGVNATGAEFELDAKWASGLQGRASYSFTNTIEPLTQQAIPNSPRQLGKLNLSIPVIRQNLFASFDAQYTSPVQTLGGNSLSGFAIVNGTLLGHAFGRHLDVSASVYNLLDKRYFDPGRPEDPENAIQQDGRTYRIKLTTRF
jgi:iron complex outermembrane receptor protein